jgi:hypothetical protein
MKFEIIDYLNLSVLMIRIGGESDEFKYNCTKLS